MKKASNWVWGCVLVALGIILGINALEIAHIDIFFPGWWTLFIIVPCAISLFTEKRKSGAIAGLVIGICLLLSCLGVLPFGLFWKLLLPVLLIFLGCVVIARGSSNGAVVDKIRQAEAKQSAKRHIVEAEVVDEETDEETDNNGKEADETDSVDNDDADDADDADESEDHDTPKGEEYWSTFSDQDINYGGKTFRGCRGDAGFGGADLDLRNAKIENEAIIRASSIFGGIIVYVPEDIKVEIASTSIFGGASDKRKKAKAKDQAEAKTAKKKFNNAGKNLYIDATCVFGGVEIR